MQQEATEPVVLFQLSERMGWQYYRIWFHMGYTSKCYQNNTTQLAAKRLGYQNPFFSLRQREKTVKWTVHERLAGETSGQRKQGGRATWAEKQLDPDHVPVWIHQSAAYHTLLASGAERNTSHNVAHWLYHISAPRSQLRTRTQTRAVMTERQIEQMLLGHITRFGGKKDQESPEDLQQESPIIRIHLGSKVGHLNISSSSAGGECCYMSLPLYLCSHYCTVPQRY